MIKRISFSLLCFALTAGMAFGQVDAKEAKKSLKAAQKALGQYRLDN